MILKSPCIQCAHLPENKSTHFGESCAVDCLPLLLYQEAVRVWEAAGFQPNSNQCAICRQPSAVAYCAACVARVTRYLEEAQAKRKRYEEWLNRKGKCHCGGIATHGELCQRCYNSTHYQMAKDKPVTEFNTVSYHPEIRQKNLYHICEICGKTLNTNTFVMRRYCGRRIYAHTECAEAKGIPITEKKRRKMDAWEVTL